MAEGRGSAIAMAAAAFLGLLLLHSQVVDAATFTVGDGNGWGFGASSWPAGKTFRAGDILVFNYDPQAHNVVAVSQANYNSCSSQGGKVFSSGNDKITLVKGGNYFICSIGGHCQAGMKIAVTAQ